MQMNHRDLSKEARKKGLQARLARVEGQIRAIRRMIDEGERCEAIAQQLAASRTAINKAFCEMMACAIEHEVDEDSTLDEAAQRRLSDLTRLLTKYG
jgi:CsoR family transcriptional regulator, copper-sensing transcriptional repressor